MRSNFHVINATWKHVHNLKEHLYGVAEYVQSFFKPNILHIKNDISIKLRANAKIEENNLKIANAALNVALKIFSKVNNNNLEIKNELKSELHIPAKVEESIIKFSNTIIIYISKIIELQNVIKIYNSASATLKINAQSKNDLIINNNDVSTNVNINLKIDDSRIAFQNDSLNAAAWYFVRLEAMPGGLDNYYNQTLENTMRKKVT